MGEKLKTRWHSCNVLRVGAEARNVWQFDARNGGFVLNREQTSLPGEPLPQRIVSKDWRALWQRKLNVAWLAPEHVFLRAAQLPMSDFNETLSMVELQLEKLSPIPVTQIVWSIHVLPHAAGNMQTVIVMIASRNLVEQFLGELEGQGYLADRLELPLLDQLQATAITEDGVWIYPDPSAASPAALGAWWYGGVLQNLDIISLPLANRAASLKEQLLQMSWAGELEGWLTGPPRWHLVADGPTAALWENALREALDQSVEILPPLTPPELAALTARRAAHAEPKANLLPAEFSTRYQQQFVDRLWMRALLAVAAIYIFGVLIYGAILGVKTVQTRTVENQVTALANSYTNALQLRARYEVLKDRQELKYAALDCYNALAKLMPESITLEQMNFSDGRKIILNGSAPKDKSSQVTDFYDVMRKAKKGTDFLFETARETDTLKIRDQGGAGTVLWDFALELKRTEAP